MAGRGGERLEEILAAGVHETIRRKSRQRDLFLCWLSEDRVRILIDAELRFRPAHPFMRDPGQRATTVK